MPLLQATGLSNASGLFRSSQAVSSSTEKIAAVCAPKTGSNGQKEDPRMIQDEERAAVLKKDARKRRAQK